MADEDYAMPEVDASYGLIYRLNFLWAKVDRERLSGHYDTWELTLDTVFSNLLYREEPEVIQTENGEVEVVTIQDESYKIWERLKKDIAIAKQNKVKALLARDIGKLNLAKRAHYDALNRYDIWVRKFMHTLKLYMKESERNPSLALFGGAFGSGGKKKR